MHTEEENPVARLIIVDKPRIGTDNNLLKPTDVSIRQTRGNSNQDAQSESQIELVRDDLLAVAPGLPGRLRVRPDAAVVVC